MFEGGDAAGKGGAIKRLTQNLDPRGYVVWPIAAPHGDDRERHYLYRFWRRLPEDGQIAIFDRSWYGRVLVERVEGYCTAEAWARAYPEINQFERQLVARRHGDQILDPHLEGGTAQALRARAYPLQVLEADPGGLAQPRQRAGRTTALLRTWWRGPTTSLGDMDVVEADSKRFARSRARSAWSRPRPGATAPVVVGAREHVLDRVARTRARLLAVAPVLVGQLPALQRVVLARA